MGQKAYNPIIKHFLTSPRGLPTWVCVTLMPRGTINRSALDWTKELTGRANSLRFFIVTNQRLTKERKIYNVKKVL